MKKSRFTTNNFDMSMKPSRKILMTTTLGKYLLKKEKDLDKHCIRVSHDDRYLYTFLVDKGIRSVKHDSCVVCTIAYYDKCLFQWLPLELGNY